MKKSFLRFWNLSSNIGIHSGLELRDIRITRLINRISLFLLITVTYAFIYQSIKFIYLAGYIPMRSVFMLLTFGPYVFVFYLNKKAKYYSARLLFLLLPLITTVFWMFVDSSRAGNIHYVYLVFPIPIVIFFKGIRTQVTLVTLSLIAFLISHYIIQFDPWIITETYSPYLRQIIFAVLLMFSFLMLRFFVSEIDKSESKLTEKNIELEEFSRLASHDMREPLRTIGSFSSLLKSKYADEMDSKANEYLNHIESGISRLDNLLSDLSNYSMIENSNENLSIVNLNLVLHSVKNDLQKSIQETGTEILSSPLPFVNAKTTQMRQLFQNLISNSIKFQPLGGNQNPKISITSHSNNEYHFIEFSDNGIGIQKQYLDQIFLKFRRLNTRDKYEGTGLGLATCKRIVEFYKGHISIKSEFGKGTTVTIQLMK